MITRGDIYWVDLGVPEGSKPGARRPVAIIQADPYNSSGLATVLGVVLTKNQRLASMPGNLFLPKEATGLPADSVANVTALVTLDKDECRDVAGTIPSHLMRSLDEGLRRVLAL
ncbi:MAG: type II toxin-antitoxin system PemK/MazF family toxin [Candidatus Nanopelagicales bacterium]|nr:type II toxin-antitoxin system PemK/MazF family toxin [Candidatus Nanopelagicales bacterium]MDZ4249642.1 type II toxin-antitoxin system PemK/MazF family toxin [Candidatus Nanopelagicales bacterium]